MPSYSGGRTGLTFPFRPRFRFPPVDAGVVTWSGAKLQSGRGTGTGTNPCTVVLPGASTTGKLVVIAASDNTGNTLDTPAGWTRIANHQAVGDIHNAIYWRAGDGTTLSTNITDNGGGTTGVRHAVIVEYDVTFSHLTVAQALGADNSAVGSTDTSQPLPAVTGTTQPSLYLTSVGLSGASGSSISFIDSTFVYDEYSASTETNSRTAIGSLVSTGTHRTTATWLTARTAHSGVIAAIDVTAPPPVTMVFVPWIQDDMG